MKLEEALKEIKKKFGDDSIGTVPEMKVEIEKITSGSPYINYALNGGFPLGKLIELYGPYSSGKSLIAYRTIAEAQKRGKSCILFDVENSFDPNFAQKLGIDVNKLIICKDSLGETMFDKLVVLLQSDPEVIVVDSIAALVPQSELEDSMEQQTMGLHARLMSKALRKVNAVNKKTALIFINQLREKIGCFQYNTRVVLEDGSTKKIGYIVNNKIKTNVLSYNHKNGLIEPTPIINWFKNGKSDKFIQFVVNKPEGRGRSEFACTEHHKIFTKDGYKMAKDINIDDEILIGINDFIPSNIQKEIIIGGLLGDGCLRKIGSKFQYRETHCKEQNDYLKWKASYFKNKTIGNHKRGGLYFETYISKYLEKYYDEFYVNNKKHRIPKDITLTPLSLAVWYQDDGYLSNGDNKAITISTNCFDEKSINNIRKMLLKKYDISTKLKYRKKITKTEIELTFGQKDTIKFFDVCINYIHPSMKYKLPQYDYKSIGNFIPLDKNNSEKEYKEFIAIPSKVINKYIKPKTEQMIKFDIETDNHNYLADGAIVHNSYGNPETVTGGRALGFYASIRLEIRRGEFILANKEKIGQEIKFKVTKSKIGYPFKSGILKFDYGTCSFDSADELISVGIITDKIKRRGAYYDIFGETFQGKDQLVEKLIKEKDFSDKIYKEIMSK